MASGPKAAGDVDVRGPVSIGWGRLVWSEPHSCAQGEAFPPELGAEAETLPPLPLQLRAQGKSCLQPPHPQSGSCSPGPALSPLHPSLCRLPSQTPARHHWLTQSRSLGS